MSDMEPELGSDTKISPIEVEFRRQISRGTTRSSVRSRSSTARTRPEVIDDEKPEERVETKPAPLGRIIRLNMPEMPLIVVGCVAAALQGSIFPSLAYLVSEIMRVFNLSPEKQEEAVNLYVMILCIFAFGAGTATFFMIFMFNVSGEKLTLRLRDMAFRSMLRQEVGWFDDRINQVGSLTSRLATDAAMVKAATGAHLSTLINSFATTVFSLGLAFIFSWRLALVCSAFIPLLIVTGVVQNLILVAFAKNSKKSMEEGGKIVSEVVENIRTVASLTKEDYFVAKYTDHFSKAFTQGKKRAHVLGFTWGFSQGIFSFTNATTYGYGAYLMSQGTLAFEDVFRVIAAIANGAVEIGRINAFAADYSKAKVAAAKLLALFDRKSLVDPTDQTGERPAACKGGVTFKKVAFRYPTRPEAQVLKSLSVSVNPGQSLALVGSSGCGKSTTIQLLERFYDPEKGIVMVDDTEVTNLNIGWLRSQLGIVAQEPMLFETTIRDNIAYGDNSRDVPIEDVIEVAKQANIHNFIVTLPNGYNTELGSRGVQLVGGQKQRIAIARALIRNPKVLLLDEATSALDTDSEKVVQEALDLAQEGRTSIVIAHRLSTIENADIIAVIDGGKVMELGTHTSLMAQRGLYFMLQMIQKGVKLEEDE